MRVKIEPLQFWFHDLCSCLQDCFAILLIHKGHDPIVTMGASWEFFHSDKYVRNEEFYYPSPRGSLDKDLFPFHPVQATWRSSDDAYAAWEQIRSVLIEGRPVIAVEDNFYMPNRPAFGDVHAAHLVVVTGFDDEAEEVFILEPTPPLYDAAIPLRDFIRARQSVNEMRPNTRDFFFAGVGIDNRWIDVTIDPVFPEPDCDWVRKVLSANLERFHSGSRGSQAQVGIDGLAAYLDDIHERSAGPEGAAALCELYTVGWASQSATALHADFLRKMGRALEWDALSEAGRHVDQLANDWTALRLLGAHGGTRGRDVRDQIKRRSPKFVEDHRRALEMIAHALKA